MYQKALRPFDLSAIDWAEVEEAASGMSQAEMIRSAEDAARSAVLKNDAVIDTLILLESVHERRGPK